MMEQCKYCEGFYETNEGGILKDSGVTLGWYCNECLAKMTAPPGEEEKLKAIPLKAIYWADFNLSHGCDLCAALPEFKRFRKRKRIDRAEK